MTSVSPRNAEPHPFHGWLARKLEKRGETWVAFSARTGIGTPTLNRWKNGEISPSVKMVRRVAEALDLKDELLRLLVIADILTPAEADQSVVVPDLTRVTDDDLISEVERRIKRLPSTSPAQGNSSMPLFRS